MPRSLYPPADLEWRGWDPGQRVVRVRTCREIREVEPAPEVPREKRAEVWGRWLAEGRYRSAAELARASGVSRETVSAALRIARTG